MSSYIGNKITDVDAQRLVRDYIASPAAVVHKHHGHLAHDSQPGKGTSQTMLSCTTRNCSWARIQ
jgi:hypothetical protein